MITDIGPHRVQHGDVMDSFDALMGQESADLFYTDPPWGEGAVKLWYTLNRKDTGVDLPPVALHSMLHRLFDLAETYARNYAIIEYGRQWKNLIEGYARRYEFHVQASVNTVYKSGGTMRPLHVHILAKDPHPLPDGYIEGLEGTHGLKTVRAAILPLATPGGIVLDPMCGTGMTGQVAAEAGMHFRGNEMNAKRLQKAIARLEKTAQHAHIP